MIGLLAGMGPRSTAPFVDLVVRECQIQYGATHDIDFPPMMIYSLPTPFYIDRPIHHSTMRATIFGGLRQLESIGVDFIAMPCNAAHVYLEQLTEGISVPLINMISVTVAELPKRVTRVALLAARPTVEAGLYQAELSRIGVDSYVPQSLQQEVDQLLIAIKRFADAGSLKDATSALAGGLTAAGVDAAILASTDLAVVSSDLSGEAFATVDSSRALARAVVRRWRAS